jgi:hypothetical protein
MYTKLRVFKKIYDQISIEGNTPFEIRTKFELKSQAKYFKLRPGNKTSTQCKFKRGISSKN